jgi:hypothetical protein
LLVPQAGGMGMAVAQKWASARIVTYRVEGVHSGREAVVDGDYEHFQTVSHSLNSGDQVQIKGTRTYPPANDSNYPGGCSMRAIPGGTEEALLWVAGAGPEGLGMPITKGGSISALSIRLRPRMTSGQV